jgi:hypothetical protein
MLPEAGVGVLGIEGIDEERKSALNFGCGRREVE